MKGNRAKAESFILKYIEKLAPKSANYSMYKKLFESMNDKQFEEFIDDLANKKKFLCITDPNFKSNGITVENNLKIAEELGHDFFQNIWIEGQEDSPTYLTPVKYMVVDLPVKRASQTLMKKIKVPEHNRVIDTLSGQPTGDSKGAKLSYPEIQVCAAMGMDQTMEELLKFRGGDNKGWSAYNGMIHKYGKANLKVLENYSSGVESTKQLKTFLSCMLLKNSL